jgi:hypothetical protein
MTRRPSCIQRPTWTVTHADCFEALQSLDADTVDAVITDPPYGIGVNGMEWDRPARLGPAVNDDVGHRPRTRSIASSSSLVSGAARVLVRLSPVGISPRSRRRGPRIG